MLEKPLQRKVALEELKHFLKCNPEYYVLR